VLGSAFKGPGCGYRGALTQAFRRVGCLSSEDFDGGTILFLRVCPFSRPVDPGTEQDLLRKFLAADGIKSFISSVDGEDAMHVLFLVSVLGPILRLILLVTSVPAPG
jgi:hypothetical protein